MPTKHRRIAVTEDPELARAMRNAAVHLPDLSDASLVRELALRGARSLPVTAGEERMRQILDRTGASPPRGNLQDYLKNRLPEGEPDPADPHRMTRLIDEARSDRL